MLNIIHGLRHIMDYNIVHLDLKPINIIVPKNKKLIVKIIDFGEAYHPEICPKGININKKIIRQVLPIHM